MIRRIDGLWVKRWFGRYSVYPSLLRAIFGIKSPSLAIYQSDDLREVWMEGTFRVFWFGTPVIPKLGKDTLYYENDKQNNKEDK